MLENACDVEFANIKLLCLWFESTNSFSASLALFVPKRAKVSALTPVRASERPARPPAQKVNATWRDCEPPRGCWDSHMARQICQGGLGDTRLGAVLGDTRLSLGISSRCHLSDESGANGIVFPCLRLYGRPLPLCLPTVSLCSWQQWKAHTCHHAASKTHSWLRAGTILEPGSESRSKGRGHYLSAPSEEALMRRLLFPRD